MSFSTNKSDRLSYNSFYQLFSQKLITATPPVIHIFHYVRNENIFLIERRNIMFWVFILLTGFCALLYKLGTFSVWLTVLSAGLKFSILLIVGLVAVFIFNYFKANNHKLSDSKTIISYHDKEK